MESYAPLAQQMSGLELASYVSRRQSHVFVRLTAVIAVSGAAWMIGGFRPRDLVLIVASVFSIWAVVKFGHQIMEDSAGSWEPSFTRSARGLALFVSLAMAYYLTLYEGFWRAYLLFGAFSWTSLVARVVFLLVGWQLATTVWRLTEIPQQLRLGRLVAAEIISPAI